MASVFVALVDLGHHGLQLLLVIRHAERLGVGGGRAEAGDSVVRHALILGDHLDVLERARRWRLLDAVLQCLGNEAFHTLAMLRLDLAARTLDEALQGRGMLGDTVDRAFQHLLQLGVVSVAAEFLDGARHLIVRRPEVFDLLKVDFLEAFGIGHLVSFRRDRTRGDRAAARFERVNVKARSCGGMSLSNDFLSQTRRAEAALRPRGVVEVDGQHESGADHG